MLTTENFAAAIPAAPPSTPATPAAAPTAPTAPETPQTPQAPSIEQVQPTAPSANDRWRQASQQVARTVDLSKAAEHALQMDAGPETPHWAAQPRDEQGKWTTPPAEPTAPPAPDAAAPAPDATATPTESPAAEAAPAASTDAPEHPAIAVPLTGRNGETITVEVDDPDAADALRALQNNGMRKEEFTRRLAGVEQKEAEYREFRALVQTAPELLVDQMSPEVRARFAQYLLATSFDQVRPTIEQWYADDLSRREAMLTMRDQTAQARTQYQTRIAAERREAEILRAVGTLIPESASPDDAADFQRVAIATLSAEIQARGDVDPRQVPALLDRDLRRFGWMPPAEPAPHSTPSLLATTPVPARTPSAPAVPASPQPTVPNAPAVAAQRKAAAPVAPGGAGAAPQATPPRPASWKDAARMLRQVPQDQWKGLAF